MWRVIWFFLGVSRLSITGASPEWCMQRLAKARIAFHFCAKPDDFTAEVWILRRDEARAAQLVRMGGCDCAVIERGGFSTVFGGLRKRPRCLFCWQRLSQRGSLCRNMSFSTKSRETRLSRARRSCGSCGAWRGVRDIWAVDQAAGAEEPDAASHSEAAVADGAAEPVCMRAWSCGNGQTRLRCSTEKCRQM